MEQQLDASLNAPLKKKKKNPHNIQAEEETSSK